mgnify:CR=1 FL=1
MLPNNTFENRVYGASGLLESQSVTLPLTLNVPTFAGIARPEGITRVEWHKDAKGVPYITNGYDAWGRVALQGNGLGSYEFYYKGMHDVLGETTRSTTVYDPEGNAVDYTYMHLDEPVLSKVVYSNRDVDPDDPARVLFNKRQVCGPADPAGWDSYCKGDKRALLHPQWVVRNRGRSRFRTDAFGRRAPTGLLQVVARRRQIDQPDVASDQATGDGDETRES